MRGPWTQIRWRPRWLPLMIACLVVGLIVHNRVLVEFQIWRAEAAYQRADFRSMLGWLQAAAVRAPSRGEISFSLARAHRRLGDAEGVTRSLKRAAELKMDLHRLQREESLMLLQAGQLGMESREVSAMLANPEDDGLEIYNAIVLGSMVSYQTETAHVVLESWIGDYPEDPQPYYLQGLIHENDGQWAAAEVSYRSVLDRAADRRDARLHLAHVLREQYRYSEAILNYQHCLRVSVDGEVLSGLGRCYQQRLETESARSVFQRLLHIDPNHYDGLLALGQLDLAVGRWSGAVGWLSRAVRARPREFAARFAYAKALLFSGDLPAAREQFQESIVIQDGSRRLRALMGQVRHHPENPHLRHEVGEALLLSGQSDDAVWWFRGVLRIDPEYRPTHRRLAEHYENLGEPQLAARHRRLAGEAEPD